MHLRSSPRIVLWQAGSLHVFSNIETRHIGAWLRGHSYFTCSSDHKSSERVLVGNLPRQLVY